MLKRAIKNLLRKSAHMLQRWAQAPASQTGPLDSWAAPYTLNPLFVNIMEECHHSYVWPAVQAANLAQRLRLDRVSFIEFGVAGGNSLVKLEAIARRLEERFGLRIEVYGFDTGAGLVRPRDYRDMPNLWSEGAFPMDVEKLRQRLTKAELVLGPVEQTVTPFLERAPAPVAFVAFDLDYYSSTMQAFALFQADQRLLLPRVHCFFDDILGYTFCDFNGERLAITDFNAANSSRKLAAIHGIRYYVPECYANEMWEKYYMLHIFDHDLYACNDGSVDRQDPVLKLQ
jgi:hypothetical protein